MIVEELVIKEKKKSIIFNVIIIILCLFSFIVFNQEYIKILKEDYFYINSLETLNYAIDNNERFVSMDLSSASIKPYSLKSEVLDKKLNLYIMSYDEKKIMIFLRDNTILTDKVYLCVKSFSKNEKSIKEIISDNDNFYDVILTNDDYTLNRNIELMKVFIFVFLIIISLLSIVFDIFGIINPKKTHMYKKYLKKLY